MMRVIAIDGTAGSGKSTVSRAVARQLELDHLDTTRPASPLVVPEGALVIDTTDRSVEDIVEEIVREAACRSARPC